MSNPRISNFDTSKTFVWNPRTTTGTFTNGGYDDTLLAGTVMGRISATQKLTPLQSTASDGSQFPVGILLADTEVEAGADATLTIVVEGDVVESKLVFDRVGDTLSTVVSGRSLRDRIGADTVGIKLVGGDQLTGYDNQPA